MAFLERDPVLAKLSVPGLFVDRMLQFWLHRGLFDDSKWLAENSEMVWRMVSSEVRPRWSDPREEEALKADAVQVLGTAVRILTELELEGQKIPVQPSFAERITPAVFSLCVLFGISCIFDGVSEPPFHNGTIWSTPNPAGTLLFLMLFKDFSLADFNLLREVLPVARWLEMECDFDQRRHML